MSGGTTVEVCENCGSPLELDLESRCRWCHAHVRVRQPERQRNRPVPRETASLVPDAADDCFTSSPFLYLLLCALGPGLSHEPVIQDYLREQPVFLHTVRSLTTAVSEAGVRVRDAGLLKDDFDMNLRVYTAEEVWVIDLAIDVLAWLGTLDGLPGKTVAQLRDNLRLLDRDVAGHTWNKELKRAGDGQERFRELRAKVPRRSR